MSACDLTTEPTPQSFQTYFGDTEKHIELHVVVDAAQWIAMGKDETVLRSELYSVFSDVNAKLASLSFPTIDVRVTTVTVFCTDPYSFTSYPDDSGTEVNAESLLNEFNTWQKLNSTADHSMLYSALDLQEQILNYSLLADEASVLQATFSNTINANLVAHGLGHNLSLTHDGVGINGGCSSSGFVMNFSLSEAVITEFSSCSNAAYSDYMQETLKYNNIPTQDFFLDGLQINYLGCD